MSACESGTGASVVRGSPAFCLGRLRRQGESCFLIDLFDGARKTEGARPLLLGDEGAELPPGRFDRCVAIGLSVLEHAPDQHDELAGERGDGDVVASLAPNDGGDVTR